MVIDFKKLEEEVRPQFKGGVGNFLVKTYEDDRAKIMYGRLEPGCSIGLHTHEGNSEIIYIVSGEVDYIMDDGMEHGVAGQCHYCPMGHSHSQINNGTEPLEFFAVVQ